MPLPQENSYTIADIYALPDGKRAELIDGQIYDMAPPSRIHQEIVQFIAKNIGNYIDQKKGSCKVYPAPFAVFLDQDDKINDDALFSQYSKIGENSAKNGLKDV